MAFCSEIEETWTRSPQPPTLSLSFLPFNSLLKKESVLFILCQPKKRLRKTSSCFFFCCRSKFAWQPRCPSATLQSSATVVGLSQKTESHNTILLTSIMDMRIQTGAYFTGFWHHRIHDPSRRRLRTPCLPNAPNGIGRYYGGARFEPLSTKQSASENHEKPSGEPSQEPSPEWSAFQGHWLVLPLVELSTSNGGSLIDCLVG